MPADVAKRGGPEQRIHQCMKQDVAVGMRGDALRVRNRDAAKAYRVARPEAVHVEAMANPHLCLRATRKAASANARSVGRVTLMFCGEPGTSRGRSPSFSTAAASSVASNP